MVVMLLTGNSVAKDAQEHGKVDWSWRLAEHLLQVVVLDQSTQRIPGDSQVVLVYDAVLVRINEAECFFEFGNLVLCKHGEDI